ncbi:hypothetical protein GCM10027578_24480 [Spirosoma luteolum]
MISSVNSLPFRHWLAIAFLLASLPLFGQIGPSIKPKDGRYDICLREGQTKVTVTILLDVPAGASCPLKTYRIDWGDGIVDPYPFDPAKLELTHEYDVKDFVDQCRSDLDRTIKFRQTDNCGTGNPANNSFDFTLRNIPRPRFTAPAVCAGQTTTFTNQTCPQSSQYSYNWLFGDQTAASPTGSHTYANKGTYTATLSVSGVCGPSTPFSAPVTVLDKAQAAIKDSGAVQTSNDTLFLCLSSGAVLRFDGTPSTGATTYAWSISGPGQTAYLDKTDPQSPRPKAQFPRAGDYMVTLTVDNPCRIPNRIQRVVRVLDLASPTLKPQNDTCQAFTYRIGNPIAGATYTLNGQTFDPQAGIPLALSDAPYVVSASTANVCGSRPVQISFRVSAAKPVRIALPRTSTVCAGSGPIRLRADRPGGVWTLKNPITGFTINAQRADTSLLLGTNGTVQLLYRVGLGACQVLDSVVVTVSGVQVSVSDLSVCAGQAKVKLPGTPAGGSWSTPNCTNCIKNDSLLLTGLTTNQLVVTYQVSGAGGCLASGTFAVRVGQPKAAFAIVGQCTDKPITVTNNSTGADTFEWLVNSMTVATGRQPTLVLPPGQQTVVLRARSGSCENQAQQSLTLISPPATLRLTTPTAAGCAPLPTTFSVNPGPQPGVAYQWHYGDGASAADFSAASHTYQNTTQTTRVFTATLTASNACGTQEATTSLSVRPLAFAEIGIDSTTIRCTPATIRFANRSIGQGQTSLWDFGDGSTRQTLQDTVYHFFAAPDSARTFRIRLFVQNSCGRDTDAVSIRVYPTFVKPGIGLSADRPCAGEPVQFTDATVPRPTAWVWRFSDGTIETTEKTLHRFAEADKLYTVTLTAYTPCGYSSKTVSLTTTPPPTASFSINSPFSCQGQLLAVTNTSDPRYRFRWSFGDGSPIDSVNYSPQHIFSGIQTSATISLTVIGSSNGCATTQAKTISIRPRLKPEFSIEGGNTICTSNPIRLISAEPNATQYRWQIGSGPALTTPTPEVTLPPGRHDITLTVSYDGVCADSSLRTAAIHVLPCEAVAPEAFTPGPDSYSPVWTIFGDEGATRIQRLRIWNRWGEVIFDASDIPLNSQQPGECWDGTNRGVPMPAGEYAYEAEVLFRGNRTKKLIGSVALVR